MINFESFFKNFDSHKKSRLPIIKSIFIINITIFLLLILYQSCSISCSSSVTNNTTSTIKKQQNKEQGNQEPTMKVHPMPKKRNSVTIQYYSSSSSSNNNNYRRDPSHNKKLRRLPHIFSRVLELPFRSDADVSVEENPDCFRFVAETDNIGEVRAHTIEIYPGVTKIVIRPNGYLELSSIDDLELDMWRFRLPESTRPELASAVLIDGELIVTVPKGDDEVEEGSGNNGEFRGGMGSNNNARLVLVQ